ncbi:hypothetical protein Tsubulata_020160 [Turnera subulata]|uniref:Protein PAIR1 n=1 Tax=Turnera subulata TaxID=218843 RepID=A0A9Q0JK32_9ROSI|nr:hypothetical protein Tsubulata_020160 [Turnera subulata]
MKLKINKACDLSSISVLPPQSRRLSSMPPGPQASQHRSQPSQQSFSQGISSQHGMFSQLSQTSLDEAPPNDQRFSSQERENSLKRTTCLPPLSFTREESQMPISRSSTNMIRKWNPAPVADHKCQVSEELEHRIGVIETLVNKFGRVLDSVQSDVMQVNKGTKEVSLEAEGIRQKLNVLETSLQLMNKGQDDAKGSIDESLKSLSQQLSKDVWQDKLQQIFLLISTLPQQIEASALKLQTEILKTFTKEIQSMACSLKPPSQNGPSITLLKPKVSGSLASPQRKPEPLNNPALPPKINMGGWNSVKPANEMKGAPYKEQKINGTTLVQQERKCRGIIDSDEEIDGGFSCLIDGKDTGSRNHTVDDTKDEIERMLKRARRRKRKYTNTIIID